MSPDTLPETVDVHYRFELDDDDGGGPTGTDYLIVTMTPRKEDLRNKVLREMSVTIYLKDGTSSESGEQIAALLNEHVSWIRYIVPKE